MAQVTMRQKVSGKAARFFLDGEGRVSVDTVLLALGARLVKLDDGDGGFSVLEPNPVGRSLNVFNPGQLIDVDVIPISPAQPQAGPSIFQPSAMVLDVDNPCTYLDCEYVHGIDLGMQVTTRLYTWPEFKAGKAMHRNGDPQIELVKYPPPSFLGSPEDVGWDDLYAGLKHKEYMQRIDSWLGRPSDTGFSWLTEGSKAGVKLVFDNTIAIGSKNNEVLADPSIGVNSAVLGVNIYPRLTWPAILRTHLEYLLWAYTSQLPYMQLLTDMRTGGLFYACNGEVGNVSVIWIVVMQDMKQVKEAFQHFGKNLPKNFKDFSEEECVQFKTLPHRAKFPYQGAKHPNVMPAWKSGY